MQNDTRVEIAELRGCLRKLEALTARDFKARDENLQLQAKEYERRLEVLNNENARILAASNKSVNNEYFEAKMNAVLDRVDKVEKLLDGLIGRSGGTMAFKNNLFSVIALLFSLASLIFMAIRLKS